MEQTFENYDWAVCKSAAQLQGLVNLGIKAGFFIVPDSGAATFHKFPVIAFCHINTLSTQRLDIPRMGKEISPKEFKARILAKMEEDK